MQPALASKGAIPKQTGILGGSYNSNQGAISLGGQSKTGTLGGSVNPNQGAISLGSNQGMINQPKPDTTYTATTTTNGKGGTTTKPTPNASVLKQQQDLNAANINTPGYVPLVTDGLAGPKTQAAVAKYGSGATTTQPKTETSTSGVMPNQQQQNQQVNSNTGVNANGSTTPGVYTPQNQGTTGISQGGLIGNAVAQSQAPNSIATTAGNTLNSFSQTESPQVTAARKALSDAQNQVADSVAGIQGSGTWTGRAAGEQAILAQKSGAYLSNLQGAVTNALTSQGQQIGAAGSAGGIGNTMQGLQQGALGTAINANAPQYGVPYGTQTGQPGLPNGGINPSLSGVTTAANVQSIKDLTEQANQIQSAFNGADANFKLLVDTARQGGVNDTNVPALNTIKQNLARGLTSSAAVTNFLSTLATVRSQYAAILGGGTTTVDSQQRAASAIPDDISLGALESLQQQMVSEATNRVQGIRQQVNDLQNGTQGGTSGSTTGSGANGSLTWDDIR